MGAIDMFNDFVKLIESESLPVEAVAIADGDAIIAERHFVPDQDRNIYSHTKSYVSTAIGIAIEDGLLSLDSRLVDSFPEYVPLRCATGVGPDHYGFAEAGFGCCDSMPGIW